MAENQHEYWVRVIEYKTCQTIHSIGPIWSRRRAEKVERGVQINLNHDEFYTRIEPEDEEDGEDE